jgi:hypothetical protein
MVIVITVLGRGLQRASLYGRQCRTVNSLRCSPTGFELKTPNWLFDDISRTGCVLVYCSEFFHQRSNVQFRRFSLENYVQTHLAWGLCLLALGKRKEGEHHLEKYCAQFGVDRNDRVLRQAEKATMRGAPM